MTPTFEKLKKRYFSLALIKSVLVGIAVGGFTTGGGLIAVILAKYASLAWMVCLIGLAVAILGGLFAFLILRKNAKALAKRLDRDYILHEKVQTMLEYADKDTEMLVLQREDAETRLKATTRGKAKLGKIWMHAVAVSLAVLTFVSGSATWAITSIWFPEYGNKANAENLFSFTEWHYEYMQQLIAYVDESPMHKDAKPTTKAELERLLSEVCVVDENTGKISTLLTVTEMKTKARDSIVYLDEYIEGFNTYKALHETLRETESELVVEFAKVIRKLEIGETFDDIRATFTDDETYDKDAIAESVEAFTVEISGSFNVAENVPKETDELYLATQSLMSALESAVANKNQTYRNQQSAITSAFDLNKDGIDSALVQQADNRTAFNYIIAELVKIFEINNPPQTGGEALAPISISEEGGENEEVSGAPGSGGMEYGSNDKIYYPDEEAEKHYGEVYNEYDAKKDEILAEQEDIDEKLKDVIEGYFDKLGPNGN